MIKTNALELDRLNLCEDQMHFLPLKKLANPAENLDWDVDQHYDHMDRMIRPLCFPDGSRVTNSLSDPICSQWELQVM